MNMTDLISREEAIHAVNKAFDRESLLNTFVRSIAVKALSTMPSAHPKKGKWIPNTIIIGGRAHVSGMKCSVCGEDALNAEGDEFLTDYCPNCGARMGGNADD